MAFFSMEYSHIGKRFLQDPAYIFNSFLFNLPYSSSYFKLAISVGFEKSSRYFVSSHVMKLIISFELR